ncbi:peptidoglycan-binding protein [Patescibacteria group bacterium]|nr:peptidoglycan-binding protein [Patescibacteria group bacterium]
MKMFLTTTIIILVVCMFSLIPQTFAQSQEELEAQYSALLLQIVEELQSQINALQGVATTTPFTLPPEQVCGVRYSGDASIVSVQQELLNQGYVITKVDGTIGPETRAAVSAFQSTAGAEKVDGLIGEETRRLLTKHSVACVGDVGVTVSSTAVVTSSGVCRLAYAGENDVAEVQQELLNQGYAIEKVDGKFGPNTQSAVSTFQSAIGASVTDGVITDSVRTELARRSVSCDGATTLPPLETSETQTQSTTEPDTTSSTTATGIIQKSEIVAGVRTTTAGVPDDTAVFTYFITFKHSGIMYIPTNPDQAFAIDVINSSGNRVSVDGIDSVVSSAQKILRADGTSYFRVESGDTMSLRTSVQPGAGSYYAELARVSYTRDNALTVVNPAMINYGFDGTAWRSETVTLLN